MKNTPTESELKTGVTYTVYLGGDKTSSPVKSTILVKTKEDSGTIVVYGDVDNSGVIDAIDASWILQKAADSATILLNEAGADVDNSGVIDAIDASWVLQKAANSATVFPAEE